MNPERGIRSFGRFVGAQAAACALAVLLALAGTGRPNVAAAAAERPAPVPPSGGKKVTPGSSARRPRFGPVLLDPETEGFQALIVELRAGQEAAVTDVAFFRQGRVWVPALALLDLVEIESVEGTLHILRGTLQPGDLRLVLDPWRQRAQRGKNWRQLNPPELFVWQDRLPGSGGLPPLQSRIQSRRVLSLPLSRTRGTERHGVPRPQRQRNPRPWRIGGRGDPAHRRGRDGGDR